jgi:hypothetical protein
MAPRLQTLGVSGLARTFIHHNHACLPGRQRLSDLPDPLGRYAVVISQYNLRECTIQSPNVRNGHGVLIGPHEYGSKLATGDVVMVECMLKL